MSSRGGGGRADLIVRLIEKRADRFAPQRDFPRGPREGIPYCCSISDKFNCCRSRPHNWIPATLSTRGCHLSHPTAGFLLHSPHRGIPVAFPMRGLPPCHPTEEFLWARRERISAASPHKEIPVVAPTTESPRGALVGRHKGEPIAFHLRISSLQAASGFACSVASLSLFPYHYLPGHHNFRCEVLADHQFD
jgi:hypothetical protein